MCLGDELRRFPFGVPVILRSGFCHKLLLVNYQYNCQTFSLKCRDPVQEWKKLAETKVHDKLAG